MNHLKTPIPLTMQILNRREAARAPSPARMIGAAAAVLVLGAAGVIGLYLVKTALGINLLEGPSFMHDYFYHLAR